MWLRSLSTLPVLSCENLIVKQKGPSKNNTGWIKKRYRLQYKYNTSTIQVQYKLTSKKEQVKEGKNGLKMQVFG